MAGVGVNKKVENLKFEKGPAYDVPGNLNIFRIDVNGYNSLRLRKHNIRDLFLSNSAQRKILKISKNAGTELWLLAKYAVHESTEK